MRGRSIIIQLSASPIYMELSTTSVLQGEMKLCSTPQMRRFEWKTQDRLSLSKQNMLQ